MSETVQLELTDSEWMSLLDGERDGLPRCCANVSALRDTLMGIVRGGCALNPFDRTLLERHFYWFLEGHDLDQEGPLAKLVAQTGLPMIAPEEHPRQPGEV